MRTTNFLLLIIICLLYTNLNGQCPTADLTLASQAEVDAFKTNFPNCTQMMHELIISGADITNVDSLENISVYQDNLGIRSNPELLNINGLSNVISFEKSLWINNNPKIFTLLPLEGATHHKNSTIIIEDNSLLLDLEGIGNFDKTTSVGIFFNENLQSLSGLNFSEIHEGTISIEGNLSITDFSTLLSLKEVTTLVVGGDFGPNEILDANDLSFLSNLEKVSDLLYFFRLNITDLSNLSNLISLDRLFLYSNPYLVNLVGLNGINSLNGGLAIEFCDELVSLHGLENITSISGNSIFSYKSLSLGRNENLKTLSGLDNLISLNHTVEIYNNPNLTDLKSFNKLSSLFSISLSSNSSLTNLDDLDQITMVSENLSIRNNSLLSDCTGICNLLEPGSVGGTITINNNPSECSSQSEVEMVCFPCQFLGYTTNTWVGSAIGNWNDDPSNWSLNMLPTECHNVIIPVGNNVSLLAGNTADCYTIDIQEGAIFSTSQAGGLNIVAPD